MRKMNMSKWVKLLFVVSLFGLAAVINVPRRSEGIRVSVDVTTQTNVQMQVYYATSFNAPYNGFVNAVVRRGEHSVEFRIPEKHVQKIRLDFGSVAGEVKMRNLVVRGDCEFRPDWRDFKPNRDITRFDGKNNEISVCFRDGDPFAVYSKSFNVVMPKPSLVNWFVIGCRMFVLALTLALFSALKRIGPFTVNKKDLALIFLAICATLTRLSLSAAMPPRFGASPWDDLWFANAAEALFSGHWLGNYDSHTLIKGCVGPMIVAFSQWAGVPFLLLSTILHIVACAVFSFMLLRFSRHRGLALVAYCYLLFNPLSFALHTWQRIYRNGIVLWQLPLLICVLYQCYRLCSERVSRLFPWVVCSGILLWLFFNTREDGIWFVPFAFGCLLLSAVKGTRSLRCLGKIRRGMVFALPFVIVLAGNVLVSLINQSVYGVFIRNDRDAGNYARAMRDLYLIRPDPVDENRLSKPSCCRHYHNVYHSTVKRACEVSPTLATARDELNAAIEAWARVDGLPDGEPWGDHILFALRNGAFAAGYYQCLNDSEGFWGRVHNELQQAFADGRLDRRGWSLTAMAAPFQTKFLPLIAHDYWLALRESFSCANVLIVGKESAVSKFHRTLFRRVALAEDDYAQREDELKNCVGRLCAIANWYAYGCIWLFGISAAFYIVWTVWLIKIRQMEGLWLLATGVVCSGFLHSACIAYISASTFHATNSSYLCPSYLCFMMFSVIVLNGVAKTFRENRKSGEICKTDM